MQFSRLQNHIIHFWLWYVPLHINHPFLWGYFHFCGTPHRNGSIGNMMINDQPTGVVPLGGGDWLPWILNVPINIMNFKCSQKYWECHHPNWRSHIFNIGLLSSQLTFIFFRGIGGLEHLLFSQKYLGWCLIIPKLTKSIIFQDGVAKNPPSRCCFAFFPDPV